MSISGTYPVELFQLPGYQHPDNLHKASLPSLYCFLKHYFSGDYLPGQIFHGLTLFSGIIGIKFVNERAGYKRDFKSSAQDQQVTFPVPVYTIENRDETRPYKTEFGRCEYGCKEPSVLCQST